MKKFLLLCLAFTAATVFASVYEIDFNRYPFPGQWKLPEGFVHDPTGGESGSGALRYQRKPGDPYVIGSHRIKMEPGAKYRLSVMVRCENVETLQEPRIIAVEYKKNGKHVSGNYNSKCTNGKTLRNGIWEEVTLEVLPPEQFDTASIAFFLRKNASGTIWYDNLRLEKTGTAAPDIFDIPPSNLTIRGSEADLSFRAIVYQPIPLKSMEMKISAAGNEQTVPPGASGYFKARFTDLSPGRLPVTAELRDVNNGKILGRAEFNYFVTADPPSVNASQIDENGLVVLDGKPFLPIGFYCGNITEPMLKRISEAGANFIMPYSIGREKDIPGKLDLAWRYKIKVLFNVMYQHENQKSKITQYRDAIGIDAVLQAWVNEFRSHPALLGWYLSDENPREELSRLRQMREMINTIDPDHFTVTLTYRPIDFPAFISTGDIFAADPYPVETASSKSMESVFRLINRASELTSRVWMVPQAFNWGVHKKQENPDNPYRFPTEQEIRSMVLSGAVNGAKGFLFYNHDSIFVSGERKYPGTAEKNWLQVVPSVKLLNELSPFFLSTENPPKVMVEGSKTRARAWRQNGKVIVAITGDGPGKNEAVITVPGYDQLKSRFGFTENSGDGKYRFKAQDISSDILE